MIKRKACKTFFSFFAVSFLSGTSLRTDIFVNSTTVDELSAVLLNPLGIESWRISFYQQYPNIAMNNIYEVVMINHSNK